MNKKIWLSNPHMGGGEMKYIEQAFAENWIAPLGPNVNGLEHDIQKFLEEDIHVAALSSGTAAIHLALVLLDVEAGDYVICQSLTFSASANPIVYLGAHPIFVDSEQDTWNLCPNAVEDAIKFGISKGKKPKAIIAVSLYGMPYKADEINELSKRYDIPVIEDSAEALGSTYKGQKCGTFGDLGVLSFNGNKIITTSGGGALILKHKEFKKKAVFLSTQAKDDAPHYEHTKIGYNYRMSNICAGIGRGQMEVLLERVNQRRANHQFYKELFQDHLGFTLHEEPNSGYYSNHWLSIVRLHPKAGITKSQLIQKFAKENIESRPIWKPMHLQPVFKTAPHFGSNLSEKLFNNGLCLPSGSNLTDDDRERIKLVFDEIIQ
ncbi:DegT/DnrJ/EryC1/StrS family aminotransferase [Kaistella antarctica]|uniref:Pyridoxal phosphate-dependent aminotransferase n=1 Tax=Kaistella antarctica TaxID=266748 RepID=A0A448NRL9_9FLAO|nr:aminotransferase class I/II-fold pyridoxal phosphate-dependent enzyme [Kaistella antarctica]KEY18808.1 pyridoxal phosphate-dependent aminotransferase [Kaistella antarctica]SEW15190.1 dTDP-4-amino-4,6-dideoxygalactose transaminase [Kaistella antarctica]VEH99466.1 UDP-4-amino-4-deoxy-L-arabinose--oxoglutarate aminotransferase [Kaistella antarctica]